MHSTDLLVLAQSNLLPLHIQMKGSVIKHKSNRIVQTHRFSHSPTLFLESHSQQFCSSPKITSRANEEINMFGNETYRSEARQKVTKTVSISLANKKSSGPAMMQNYMKKQPKTEEALAYAPKTPPKQNIRQKFNRYQTGNIFDFQNQSRMSLSSFQQNFRAMRLKKMFAKTEQIIHLKLQGQTCRTSRILRKDVKPSKDKQNLYITQHSGQINFDKPSQTKCNTIKVRSIIGRLHEQKQKQKIKSDEENNTPKYKKRFASASQKKYERRTSANLRQKLHVNIINFVDQKQVQNTIIDKKTPFNQLYNRFAKTHNLKTYQVCNKEQRKSQLQSRVLVSSDTKDLEITNRKSKTQDFQHQRTNSCQQNQRQVESTARQKLKERKSILKNYTFRKHDFNPNCKGKNQINSPQDFYVSGWNNSTQFEKRQLIMLI